MNLERKTHIADLIRQSHYSVIDAPLQFSYFQRYDYLEYCQEIDQIATALFEIRKQAFADVMFGEFGSTHDIRVLTQALSIHVPKIANFLSRRRWAFNKSDLSNLIEFYGDLSGNYEKSIRLVRGMLEALEGKQPS